MYLYVIFMKYFYLTKDFIPLPVNEVISDYFTNRSWDKYWILGVRVLPYLYKRTRHKIFNYIAKEMIQMNRYPPYMRIICGCLLLALYYLQLILNSSRDACKSRKIVEFQESTYKHYSWPKYLYSLVLVIDKSCAFLMHISFIVSLYLLCCLKFNEFALWNWNIFAEDFAKVEEGYIKWQKK